ncbi:MAG: hypothetical protein O3B23_09775, partial [Actinomycetota bacterium]|nr:hypothetical protein [Actinomycetota bacterium]
MRRLSAIFLAAAVVLTAACSGGDKNSSDTSDGGSRTLFQPAGVVGPDSFAPTFAVASYDVDASSLTSGTMSGSAPGLYAGRTYGGSGQNICDVEAMIKFLTYYEDRGRAWADIQGIEFENLETYLRSLTPVFALQNLNVQMFGFKNGTSYGYDAVIAAGTAILIDDQGMPRARCACGNPLLGPTEEAPPGTDTPPDDDGVPETQDSVPPGDDTVPPGDDTVPPGERREPECPEEFEGNTYTDSNGDEWTWVEGNPTPETSPGGANWYHGPTNRYSTTQELEPEFIDCPEPGRQRVPQDDPDCPDWNSPPVTYTDPNGDIWIFDPAGPAWINTSDPSADKAETTDELPGYNDLCDPQDDVPGQTYDPECPQQYVHEESNSLSWTAYVTRGGDVWIFDPFDPRGWTNQRTGEFVPGDDPNALPGYEKECPSPNDRQGNPCPPLRPDYRETWIDPTTGQTWVFRIVSGSNGFPRTVWENQTTGERLTRLELYNSACPDEDVPERTPECPPGKPTIDTIWVDTTGTEWVYAANSGGADGWDNLSTEWIENLATADLPNQPDDCLPPGDQNPCPPIVNVIDGTVWIGDNGHTYYYKGGAGGWVDATDPNHPIIAYTVLLPGYRDDCLPPCPPLDLETGALGIWVDPSNGEVWIKPVGGSQWYRIPDGLTIDDTRDLPFYTEDCLPPCDPESDGGPTYQYDENEVPVAPEDDKEYDDTKDQAVTVEPGDEAPKLTQIVDELIGATVAVGDDCNPNGCVTPDTEIELGHSFTDPYGDVWRYVGNGKWQSDNGGAVDQILDIPGYADACLPDDTPPTRDCPPEYEGALYTDTTGVTWTWVGGNSDPEDSDHGRYWFHTFGDIYEYRYTVELEPFFVDCPRPDDPDLVIQEGGIRVDLRVPKVLCVGDTVELILVAVPSEDQMIDSAEINIDNAGDYGTQVERTVWIHEWTPTAAGVYEIKGSAEDTAGLSGADLQVVVVEDCGDNTDQSNPLPIDVAIAADTVACVGDKVVFQVIVTLDPRATLVSLDVERDGSAERVGQQNPTTWSGSFLAASEGEVELVATGKDSNDTSDTARHYIKVIPCGDETTPEDST